MKFDLVLLAGGVSARMGDNKLLLPLGDYSVLRRSISAFYNNENIKSIILVTRKDLFDVGLSIRHDFGDKIKLTTGGETRTQSVLNGLSHCDCEGVLIHDGARPFVSSDLINSVMECVKEYGSGIPAIPVKDSVRSVNDDYIDGFLNRNSLFSVQTPQGFLLKELKHAYSLISNEIYTDDSEVYSKFIKPAKIIEGEEKNIKITTPADYYGLNSKIGAGYDIHNLDFGRKLILCGVQIPYERGCVAHSDGDVATHALIDSLLSAIGERDIGTFFPDTDPKYKNINSMKLLESVVDIYRHKNHKINNVSIIIIADKPKLADYINQMKDNLSNILGIFVENIGISAKTTENNSPNTIECYALSVIN